MFPVKLSIQFDPYDQGLPKVRNPQVFLVALRCHELAEGPVLENRIDNGG